MTYEQKTVALGLAFLALFGGGSSYPTSPVPSKKQRARDLKIKAKVLQLLPIVEAAIARYTPTVPLALALAVLHVESEGSRTALSPAGARGYMQLMPATARSYGLTVNATLDERLDPEKNIDAGVHLLSDDFRDWGTWPRALTAYNAGPKRLKKNKNNIRWVYVTAVFSKIHLYN